MSIELIIVIVLLLLAVGDRLYRFKTRRVVPELGFHSFG
jgi:hypothetical protein